MRTRTTLSAVVLGVVTAGAFALSTGGASGHGYTDLPISRQKLCANGTVTGCGDIQYEPQSVELNHERYVEGGEVAMARGLTTESRRLAGPRQQAS